MTNRDYAQYKALGASVTNGTAAELDALRAFYRLVYGHTSEAQLMDFLRKHATTGNDAARELHDTVLPAIRALAGKP